MDSTMMKNVKLAHVSNQSKIQVFWHRPSNKNNSKNDPLFQSKDLFMYSLKTSVLQKKHLFILRIFFCTKA
jgi:hypothetical protein